MTQEEREKATEAKEKALIQVQTGDLEVAKLQLAARWTEVAGGSADLDQWLKIFARAYRSIDEAMRP